MKLVGRQDWVLVAALGIALTIITHAMDSIDFELRRARRSQMSVSLIMFDLDHSKEVKDRYGHLCGDAVLAAVGALMRDVLRGSDFKCR